MMLGMVLAVRGKVAVNHAEEKKVEINYRLCKNGWSGFGAGVRA
jgi:hypothetical protein